MNQDQNNYNNFNINGNNEPLNNQNFNQPTSQPIFYNDNSEKFNSKSMKAKSYVLKIGIVVLIVVIGLSIGIAIISSNKDKETTEVIPQVNKTPLTKEAFVKIENQYLNSPNIFNIESVSPFSKVVVTGNVGKGSFSKNDIIEFVDQYGKLRKTPVLSIEKFNINNENIVEGEAGGILISLINKEDLNHSTIMFKTQNYNGIDVSLDYNKSELAKIENYLKSKDKINILVNDNNETSELMGYYVDKIGGFIKLYLILNSNNEYLINDNVKISDLNLSGQIQNILK